MVHGSGFIGYRKRKTEFIGQKVYYEQLDVAGGAHDQFVLLEDMLDVDDDNDPAQNLESTVYLSADAAEVLAIEAVFINPHSDIKRALNQAVFRMLVECGLNARITRVTGTLGKHDLTGGAGNFTAIGSEIQPTNFANLNGPASRTIRGIIDDTTPTNLTINERLAYRGRVYGYRTAGVTTVPIILWHQRVFDDTMIEVDVLKEEV